VRVTSILADVNQTGTVGSCTDTEVVATMDSPITAGTVTVEIGPDIDLDALLLSSGLSDSKDYLDFLVTDSPNQDGSYSMARHGQNSSIPFEFELEQPLPVNRAQGGLPQYFEVELGLYYLSFSSTDTSLSTKTQVNDAPQGAVPNNSAHVKFFSGAGPFSAVGTTKYFQLPEDPKSLSVGDSLCLYQTSAVVSDSTHELTGLELSQLLVEVDPELPTDLGTVVMSAVTPTPFAKIRLHKKHNYSALESNLEYWLDSPQAQDAWFTELYRLTNPLVANKNPLLADVSTAKAYVMAFDAALMVLYTMLDAYTVDPVDAVDTLVQTYRERNADRGMDILLQGRFSDFFGITQEGMSYSGRVRELIREVSQKDLPVRSVGRAANQDVEALEGEFESTDFTYDISDTEGLDAAADIPGDWVDLTTIGR
jgi:hypothetical protein